MSRLKSWLIQLDHIINTQQQERADHFRDLRNSFFGILFELTEGVRLRPGRVDAETGRVYVETDDGEVPIESISQGMTSLLGWIGVLLHRLYEVFDEDDNPRERFGLVLIDEIDAHMHPEWQQMLIPKLSRFFPNIQFVATTHSPLIVSDMPREKVQRLARDRDGKVISLELTDDMMHGRADQILTGRLFGLETSRGFEMVLKIKEYTDLAGRDRTESEESRYKALKQELDTKIPPPDETSLERKAYSFLEAILEKEVGTEHAETNQKIRKYCRVSERSSRKCARCPRDPCTIRSFGAGSRRKSRVGPDYR
jgi:hypothetical protein